MNETAGSDHTAVQGSTPDQTECRGSADVGKIHHDEDADVWYECVFDPRRQVYTWAIVPRVE